MLWSIVPNIFYMEVSKKKTIKVIWVHLIFEKKNFFFGSVSAIYRELTDRQIGIKQSTLAHKTEDTIITSRAIIKKDRLRR